MTGQRHWRRCYIYALTNIHIYMTETTQTYLSHVRSMEKLDVLFCTDTDEMQKITMFAIIIIQRLDELHELFIGRVCWRAKF